MTPYLPSYFYIRIFFIVVTTIMLQYQANALPIDTLIEKSYLENTSDTVLNRLKYQLNLFENKASDHFDLGIFAHQQKQPISARYHILQAIKKAPQNALYLAWYIKTIQEHPKAELQDLHILEKRLDQIVTVVDKKYQKLEEKFSSERAQLELALTKIVPINQFTRKTLTELQLTIANLVSADQSSDWYNKARTTTNRGLKQNHFFVPPDYAFSGELFLRQAQHFNQLYQEAIDSSQNQSAYSAFAEIQKTYLSKKQKLKEYREGQLQKDQIGELNAIDESILQAETKREKQKHKHRKLVAESSILKGKIQQSGHKGTSDDKKLVMKHDAVTTKASHEVEKINQQNIYISKQKTKLATLKLQVKTKNKQAHKRLVNQLNNDIIPEYNRLNEQIHQLDQLWKEPLYLRDQAYSNAKSHLLIAVHNSPNDQKSRALFLKIKSETQILQSQKTLFTSRTWCHQINYQCDQCDGLDILACELSQKEEQKACLANNDYHPFIIHRTKKGMKSSCKSMQPMTLNDQVISNFKFASKATLESFQSKILRERIQVLANLYGKSVFDKDGENSDLASLAKDLGNVENLSAQGKLLVMYLAQGKKSINKNKEKILAILREPEMKYIPGIRFILLQR